MTEREALKLALEAFEEIAWSNSTDWQRDRAKVAITAIKEVLREHAMYEVQRFGQEIQPEPPQRTWVGLTDNERFELAVQTGAMTADWLPFMEAVEFKLKQKNGYDTAKGWRKRQTEEAINALETMLAGTQCTPMERDFFIRGYIHGLGAKKEPPKPLLCALCGQKAQ